MQKIIKVDGTKSTPKLITILMNTGEVYKNGEPKQDKYKIWITDQKGNQSLPYKQFQKLRPVVGDEFVVDTYEVEKEFGNHEGKTINYMDRTINRFVEVENTPVATSPQPTPENAPESLPDANKAILARIDKIEERLNKIETEAGGEPYFPQKDDEGNITVDELPPF